MHFSTALERVNFWFFTNHGYAKVMSGTDFHDASQKSCRKRSPHLASFWADYANRNLSGSEVGEVWSILASLWEGAAKGMITSFIVTNS
jgi:hypothetical protein